MSVASGPAGLVLAGPVFTWARKIPCRLPSVLYGMAESQWSAVGLLTISFPCFHQSWFTQLETRYSEARDKTNTHRMETGLNTRHLTHARMDQSIEFEWWWRCTSAAALSHFFPHWEWGSHRTHIYIYIWNFQCKAQSATKAHPDNWKWRRNFFSVLHVNWSALRTSMRYLR